MADKNKTNEKTSEAQVTKTGTEKFRSRGLGIDRTPGCFVCGGEDASHDNIAGFVWSKESGERIVAMFKTGAHLEFRLVEPTHIQVKIGACPNHIVNLAHLHVLTMEGGGTINKEIIAKAINGVKYGVAHNGGNSSYDGKPSEYMYPSSCVYSTEEEAEEAAKKFLKLDRHKDLYNLRVFVIAPDGTKIPVFGNFDYILYSGRLAIKDIYTEAKVKRNNGFDTLAERIRDGYPVVFAMIKAIGDKTVPDYKLNAALVAMLERNGLVEEYEEGGSPFDRPKPAIRLTDEGKELYEAIVRLEEKERKAGSRELRLRGGHGGE